MKKSILFLPFFLPILLAAQRETNLSNDKKFFEEKRIDYGRWLDSSGLGKILHVESVVVNKEALLLNLGFITTNGDTAKMLWNGLKKDFAKLESGRSLEEALFNKLLYFMEIEPEQGIVQLYNSYDKRDFNRCFRRVISFDDKRLTIKETNCRSVSDTITLVTTNLSKLKSESNAEFAQKTSKEAVFARVKAFVEARFLKKTPECENRKPTIEWFYDKDNLNFRVTDLCKELLDDEPNPWWCDVLKSADASFRNCRKRECIEMLIRYVPIEKGYKIYVKIDAKIGSGWYREVKRGAYVNMELDYKKYVNDYSKKFSNLLITELQKK